MSAAEEVENVEQQLELKGDNSAWKVSPELQTALENGLKLDLYHGLVKFENSKGNLRERLEPMYSNTIAGAQQQIIKIPSEEGHEVTLYVSYPPGAIATAGETSGVAVMHIHGGAMLHFSAEDNRYMAIRDQIAANGEICIGVEFRNGEYPHGLEDCINALKWIYDHKGDDHVDNKIVVPFHTIVLCGESGGGNLVLATCLKAKEDGIMYMIDGVYASAPYILGAAGYESAKAYHDDANANSTANRTAWPLYVDAQFLKGVPPHHITVNEFDPLADEGRAYYRKLCSTLPEEEKNDVTTARHSFLNIKGTFHTSDFMMALDPEEATKTFNRISSFCNKCKEI